MLKHNHINIPSMKVCDHHTNLNIGILFSLPVPTVCTLQHLVEKWQVVVIVVGVLSLVFALVIAIFTTFTIFCLRKGELHNKY